MAANRSGLWYGKVTQIKSRGRRYLFSIDKITQTARYRQALISYAQKHGVTKAAIRYHTNRQYIYRCSKRYDGTLKSLENRSHRPHSHPNQHRPDETKTIVPLKVAAADSAYDFPMAHRVLKGLGIEFLIRPQPAHDRTNAEFKRDAFTYDAVKDVYICPNGNVLRPKGPHNRRLRL